MAGVVHGHRLGSEPGNDLTAAHAELEVEPVYSGAYACERLSFENPGKVLWGKLLLPTGLGKSDRPG